MAHYIPNYQQRTSHTSTARQKLAEETVNICHNGTYLSPKDNRVYLCTEIEQCLQSTRLFTPNHHPMLTEPYESVAKIEVVNETTLQCAKHLVSQGFKKIGVLNFASAKNAGSGFLKGSQAQEESLARSSALYQSLQQCFDFYDYHRNKDRSLLYSNHVIYSPKCPVFRNDSGELLEQLYLVDFITSAAPNRGAILTNEKHSLTKIGTALDNRTEFVLRIAAEQRCEALVLGAWGCGVFANLPEQVAAAFARALFEQSLVKHFKQISFAVPYNQKRPENWRIFAKRFDPNQSEPQY
jgi:uncharacterized protein (TIGR02452 family)